MGNVNLFDNNNNSNNPPPFHLNVNNHLLYNRMPQINNKFYEPYAIPNYNIQQKNGNDRSKSADKIINKNKDRGFFKLDGNSEEGNQEKNKYKKNNIKKVDKNRYNEEQSEEDMSINIDIVNKKKVNVKIPVKNNKLWKKEYDKNELIGTIINDFIKENKLKLSEDCFNELKFFNKEISPQDKISSLLPDDMDDYFDDKSINKAIDLNSSNDKYTEVIGKPFSNPFEILCFYKSLKKFQTLCYNNDLKEKMKINKFNITSAYCNGCNHLYISGGENCLKNFWEINLKSNIINEPIKIPPKKYHSMIFIPKDFVFIVGGNTFDSFYYNLKEKKLFNWGKLNIIRVEPALLVVQNKLYCIDSINSNSTINNYTLEVTDLTSNKGKWKLLKPKLSLNLKNKSFNQQLFGIDKDINNNILFLGGTLGGQEKNIDKDYMNFMYNIKDNTIDLSQIKYKRFNLKEKAFCPFNSTYDYILTDFQRSSPQIAFYNKKKGKIDLINFSPDDSYKINGQNMENNNKDNHIKQNSDNLNNVSPVFSFKDKNSDSHFDKKGTYVSFGPKESVIDNKGNFVGMRNPNKKIVNNLAPINEVKNDNIIPNREILRKNTPEFANIERNTIINRTLQNNIIPNQFSHIKANTNIYSRTPDKFNNLNVYAPNVIRNTAYMGDRTSGHSYDSARRYYYPRIGLNQNRNMNNNYSNYYKMRY